MKSYTDIEQSKKLTEILSPESADMYYEPSAGFRTEPSEAKFGNIEYAHPRSIRCWSLAALLDVLPDEITDDGDVFNNMFFHLKGKYIIQYPRLTTLWPSLLSVEADNPIDACYEMIIKLNEQKLL